MTHLEKAQELRARTDVHFNCCQSVLVAFAEDMGLTEQQAFDLGANFGSGMRCGSVCGTLTGALMVLGMKGYDEEQSTAFLRKFREDHGEINCAALLKKSHEAGIPRKEHCDGLVFEVVQMLD
ncbi:MAG: C_GCAxxG_C_C family protein [Lawsonibacter sp.]|jgi:C_GCAxxG_C_C family probable redox protein|nr:C_GCAxxG_C_C family protein [Lawsonibacter sp.]